MADDDITKLIAGLTKSLVTKDDIRELATKEDVRVVKEDIRRLETRLVKKMDELNTKADTIMEFADEVDKIAVDHEKRLKKIENIPVIAHQIKS
ncbi:MAG: hypothetical protein ACD_38C00076G0010 [uncultured bacterium]|uniref:Uncharacterized protein n=1 Tax=Candidatus Daviesbacteria bacterium GW2011_GWC2_40_12 TaxID=1618431 RepID=A0A0G0QU38_9BACT|nr:MAG: hypothetical protein ACD_38C00076G0010 [uncultured bacterium]KKR15516.1 MAG: hypothetical protein UT45_C0020G0008 [Candidatus Daviesbacteria bacterium GW2011_GWA2_39_33]KKR22440.1 MAG: hypothetical protein UT54_C0068G0009 [Candidatus Daviesbacteria bacterium GW2011_GWB1_39_5]KKR40856.1 MAG: hypothetical protein UT77_C0018G0009 [Candidatus Daviesbacteria bacterium GW2011_GWC2_40_12]OGE22201.1 MAG: hypothetical protein A2778_03590 [Candidatus Daviesbacteria bacterium RIFCSPHIGHO2_01_FULL_